MSDTGDILLSKVLEICRCKTSINIEEFRKLKEQILKHLDGKEVDVENINTVFIQVPANQEIIKKYQTELRQCDYKNKKNVELIQMYKAREASVLSIYRKNISSRKSTSPTTPTGFN